MHYEPTCISGKHNCRSLCATRGCLIENPFVCTACEHSHYRGCEIILYKDLIKKLHTIQGLNKKDINDYEERVYNTFRYLMQLLRDYFKRFREEMESLNISYVTKMFYGKLKNCQYNSLNGDIVFYLLSQKPNQWVDYKLKHEIMMRGIKKDLVQQQQNIAKKLRYYYSFKYQLDEVTVECDYVNILRKIEEKYVVYWRSHNAKAMIHQCIAQLQQLMDKRSIHNVQIVFRASDYGFHAKQFHYRCDGMPNTLTLVKTEFGCLVGAFSPKPWRSPDKWYYEEDETDYLFLFSTSYKLKTLKFEQAKKEFAIGMHKDYGPCFGDDLVIYDRANNSKGCWSNFPDVYECRKKPIPHSHKVLKEFLGVDDHYKKFNLVEWEVYKVSFKPDEYVERSFLEYYHKT